MDVVNFIIIVSFVLSNVYDTLMRGSKNIIPTILSHIFWRRESITP